MANFVAYLVFEDLAVPSGERYEIVDMRGRILRDKADMLRWLFKEAPMRPDLVGRRIDVVDLDEKPGH